MQETLGGIATAVLSASRPLAALRKHNDQVLYRKRNHLQDSIYRVLAFCISIRDLDDKHMPLNGAWAFSSGVLSG